MVDQIRGIGGDFLQQMNQVIEEADKLLQERAETYNLGGVTLHDQCDCHHHLPSSLSYWAMLHIRFFRLKAMMNGNAPLEIIYETIRDLINETRFLYAELKTTLPDGKGVVRVSPGSMRWVDNEDESEGGYG